MSYEPTIIILKSDLHREEEQILTATENLRPKNNKKRPEKVDEKYCALLALKDALHLEGFKISGVKMVIIRPELSNHNAAIRKILDDLNIEFAVDN
jgi:hypothetical protein